MSLDLLFHYLLLKMFRMLVHPSSGACDLLWIYFMGLLLWFDVCWCYGVFRLGWCGILMQADVTCFIISLFTDQHVSNVSNPSSGACDLLCIYFMGCIGLVRCVLVLRCGSAGVVWYPYAG